jgi:isocitrate dehydrogenase kinase/phosphatase
MTTATLSDSRLANLAARTICDAFGDLEHRFRIVTRRARIRFEGRDWQGMAADARERLDLYTGVVRSTTATVQELMGERSSDRMVWAGMKAVYSGMIQDRPDRELGETFFNSVTRRIFSTVGVDQRIEFVDTDFDAPPPEGLSPVYRSYGRHESSADLVEALVRASGIAAPFQDLEGDARLAGERIDEYLRSIGGLRVVDRAEVVDAVFYRGKGAYLVGRLYSGSQTTPLVLSILHPPGGAVIDAVLLTENQASILFSFTRSYFHVDVERPSALVQFLRQLMPRKRQAELYISIGHNKHGKTELYRELLRHLSVSGERFEIAAGTRGLVMVVFTLPGFDMVVKVIKDRFPPNKQVTHAQVRERYRLVFHRDRAGRLIDAQEFEHLEFDRARFDDELADLLATECSEAVTVGRDRVTVHHAYIERRVIPLDLYIRDADPAAAEEALLDFGQAIKDMAASGVFPGDLLIKNFGVTRHGRVVFYDYDELTTLDRCVFRTIPPAATYEDDLSAEPWFSVGPDDVFPEEFASFLGFGGRLREAFMGRHADLFSAETWHSWQARTAAGELIEVFPYDDEDHLRAARLTVTPAR